MRIEAHVNERGLHEARWFEGIFLGTAGERGEEALIKSLVNGEIIRVNTLSRNLKYLIE